MEKWYTVREIIEEIYGSVDDNDPRLKLTYGFIKDSFDKDKPNYIPLNLIKRKII